jgi:hypothetical protein
MVLAVECAAGSEFGGVAEEMNMVDDTGDCDSDRRQETSENEKESSGDTSEEEEELESSEEEDEGQSQDMSWDLRQPLSYHEIVS